tara:strand:+ start:6351 stop:6827 length:477 start_codon:yes stop_codon:yes gene_type:complete
MYIVTDHSKYHPEYLHIYGKKRNNIVEGDFSKIIYSTETFSQDGLYLICGLNDIVVNNTNSSDISIKYDIISNHMNSKIIQELANIEKQILKTYMNVNSCKKKRSYVLNNKLVNGKMKIYKSNTIPFISNNINVVIKISGIWETATDIGLAVKFLIGL